MSRTRFTARTPIELLSKVYRAHGWVRKAGESRAARVQKLYKITTAGDRYVATLIKETTND